MNCVICLKANITNLASINSCDHTFCYKCIKKWYKTNYSTNNKCPLCRKPFNTIQKIKKRKINKKKQYTYEPPTLRSHTKNKRNTELIRKIQVIIEKLNYIINGDDEEFENAPLYLHELFTLLYKNIWFFNDHQNNNNTLLNMLIYDVLDKVDANDFKEAGIWKWKFNNILNAH